MKLKAYKDLIAMSKEKIDEAMAPARARSAKAKAELEAAKLDEKLVSLETKVHELSAEKDINFERLIDTLDEHALLERRKTQYAKVMKELFPDAGK